MFVKVMKIEQVKGKQFCEFWQLPMVIITTSKGEYIDFGKNIEEWQATVGSVVEINPKPCFRVPSRTWAHLGQET